MCWWFDFPVLQTSDKTCLIPQKVFQNFGTSALYFTHAPSSESTVCTDAWYRMHWFNIKLSHERHSREESDSQENQNLPSIFGAWILDNQSITPGKPSILRLQRRIEFLTSNDSFFGVVGPLYCQPSHKIPYDAFQDDDDDHNHD